jgi:hypothetical protein
MNDTPRDSSREPAASTEDTRSAESGESTDPAEPLLGNLSFPGVETGEASSLPGAQVGTADLDFGKVGQAAASAETTLMGMAPLSQATVSSKSTVFSESAASSESAAHPESSMPSEPPLPAQESSPAAAAPKDVVDTNWDIPKIDIPAASSSSAATAVAAAAPAPVSAAASETRVAPLIPEGVATPASSHMDDEFTQIVLGPDPAGAADGRGSARSSGTSTAGARPVSVQGSDAIDSLRERFRRAGMGEDDGNDSGEGSDTGNTGTDGTGSDDAGSDDTAAGDLDTGGVQAQHAASSAQHARGAGGGPNHSKKRLAIAIAAIVAVIAVIVAIVIVQRNASAQHAHETLLAQCTKSLGSDKAAKKALAAELTASEDAQKLTANDVADTGTIATLKTALDAAKSVSGTTSSCNTSMTDAALTSAMNANKALAKRPLHAHRISPAL